MVVGVIRDNEQSIKLAINQTTSKYTGFIKQL